MNALDPAMPGNPPSAKFSTGGKSRRWGPTVLVGLGFFFVLARALLPWGLAFHAHPDEDWGTRVLYTRGDIAHFTSMRALADLQVGERFLLEAEGRGVRPFPVFMSIFHALSIRVFGMRGFVLVDLLLASTYYVVILMCLWAMGYGLFTRVGTAILLVSGSINVVSKVPELLGFRGLFSFWGDRIPRPFVTEPFFLLAILVFFFTCKHWADRSGWILAGGFGALVACLAQGSLHSAIVLCIWSALISTVAFLRQDSSGRLRLLGRVAAAMGGLGLFLLPMLWQQVHVEVDVSRRLGLIPVDRLKPLFNVQFKRLVLYLLCAGPAIFVLGWLRGRPSVGERRGELCVFTFWMLLVVSCAIALPVTCVVLGKTIQSGHFNIRLRMVASYGTLIAYLHAVAVILRRFSLGVFFRKPIVRLGTLLFCSALSLAWVWQSAASWAVFPGHRNEDPFPFVRNEEGFRDSFGALTRVMCQNRRGRAKVLGTFDYSVFCWWALSQGRYGFLPDLYNGAQTDLVVEARLIDFCRRLGMDRRAFEALLRHPYVLLCWIGGKKYQAGRWYTLHPLLDYDESAKAEFLRGVEADSWYLVMSESERNRILKAFDEHVLPDSTRLDWIVLPKCRPLFDGAWRVPHFVKTYENRHFVLFERETE